MASMVTGSERANVLLGTTIAGGHRIDGVLAESGAGAEYLGTGPSGERVHVRTLYAEAAVRPELLGYFEREAIAGMVIDSPHVAIARELGVLADGTRTLVRPFFDGQSLRQILRQGPIPFAQASRVAVQIARALSAVHRHQVVHGAVTPDAIWIAPDDTARLIDFSAARLPRNLIPDDGVVGKRERVSTPVPPRAAAAAYRAPELSRHGSIIDGRIDLYGLGIVLFEMCTGAPPPFGGEPPALSQMCPGAPKEIDQVLAGLIAMDVNKRASDADAVAVSIERAPVQMTGGPSLPSLVPASMATAMAMPAPTPEPTLLQDAHPPPTPRRVPVPISFWMTVGGLGAVVMMVIATVGLRDEPFGREALASTYEYGSDDDDDDDDDRSSERSSAGASSSDVKVEPVDEMPGADAFEVREAETKFLSLAKKANINATLDALEELVKLNPNGIEGEVRQAVLALCKHVMLRPQADQKRLYQLLTYRMGESGYDILWTLVTTAGGSKAANFSADLLADESLRKRAGADVQIAYDLRNAKSCPERNRVFAAAASKGHRRTLTELVRLQHPRVQPSCPGHKDSIKETIGIVEARVQGQ